MSESSPKGEIHTFGDALLPQSEDFYFSGSAWDVETDSLLMAVEVDVDGRVADAQVTNTDALQRFR